MALKDMASVSVVYNSNTKEGLVYVDNNRQPIARYSNCISEDDVYNRYYRAYGWKHHTIQHCLHKEAFKGRVLESIDAFKRGVSIERRKGLL